MTSWRFFSAAFILVLLSACAAQQPGTAPVGSAGPQVKPSDVKVTDFPCPQIATAEGLQVKYPGESLYRSGAAFPIQDGLTCLQALAGWLKTIPGTQLLFTVSGEEGHEFDALALAAKRQELLQRYFKRQGVNVEGWQWTTVKSADSQLQITQTN